jgi:ABC-type dipeptide/oligopeptide/nickel transport system ATPase subunit
VPEPLLRVHQVSKRFGAHVALDKVSLTLEGGRALGVVGRSGSGKSTLARCIAGFERPDSGSISLPPGRVQSIFQEAAASLNPRFTAEEIVAEPLVIRRSGNREGRRKVVGEALERVGLPATAASKPALSFSGGERQRLALARALAAEPELLILDESFSGLDLLLQVQMTTLLADLRRSLRLTCILISHDLTLASRVCDELVVMHHGAIVPPDHPAAVELFDAARALTLEGALG